ncbi:hypothetical protein BYT27DRAFT_7205198 [Phlegmacium glaucopus]|nr:hypothetical protein BYT27DRAFT_7205198 [Phlegmacium glaucopus]
MGSSHTGTASSNSFFLRLRLMTQPAIKMKNMRPTRPTKPKTIPDRTLLPRKAFTGARSFELMADVCPAAHGVTVLLELIEIVCPPADAVKVKTTTGGG